MDEPVIPATSSTPSRLRQRLRKFAPLVLLVFVGGGVWFFAGRVPKEVGLRFVVPPTLRGDAGAIPRAAITQLAGDIRSDDGDPVATFAVPVPGGLDGPLAPPVGLQLKRGSYDVQVRATTLGGLVATLRGRAEIDAAGEVRVELRSAVP